MPRCMPSASGSSQPAPGRMTEIVQIAVPPGRSISVGLDWNRTALKRRSNVESQHGGVDMKHYFVPDITSEIVDPLLYHEEILRGWLATPTPDYVGFAAHLQTVAELAELAAQKTGECAQQMTTRLRGERDGDRQEEARTLDLVNAYSVAARQIALEAVLRNEYFRTLIPLRDHQLSRRLAGTYAMLAAAALKQVFMYRDRALALAELPPRFNEV